MQGLYRNTYVFFINKYCLNQLLEGINDIMLII